MDVVTLALAKGHTDKTAVGLGTHVLDLDAYGIGTNVLYLAASGGGSVEVDIDHEAFWDTVQTRNPIEIEFTASDTKLRLSVAAKTYSASNEMIIGFCCLAILKANNMLFQLDFDVTKFGSYSVPITTKMTVTVMPITTAG